MCVSCHYSLRSVYCYICSCVTHCNALTSASSTGSSTYWSKSDSSPAPAVIVSKSYPIFVTYIVLAMFHMYSHFTLCIYALKSIHISVHMYTVHCKLYIVQTGSNQTPPHSNEFRARPAAAVVMSASSDQPISCRETLNRLLPNRRSNTFGMH